MAVPTNQAFTDGLDKIVALYDSDDGTTYRISMRSGYVTAGVSDLQNAPGNTQANFPRHRHPRHLTIISTSPGPGGQQLKRKVPCSGASFNGFKPGNTLPNVVVDGLTWRVVGFHGESTK